MKNSIVKDGYVMTLEYVSVVVFKNKIPVYTSGFYADNPQKHSVL
jgi:hypothetical protein